MPLPYLVALGVLVHLLFWGAGLALLTMPRPWRRFWPVLAAPAGCALQSLVVWAGAHTGLAGARTYAWPAEAIPLVLLGLGLRRRGRAAGRDAAAFAGLGLLMAAVLGALVRPIAQAASGLTTVSLGSCDAADYAAGARVLGDFARTDRSGFLGLTEVVRVMSVDNFFDFWLRLNHFTPSALIALNGRIFDCSPAELTGLLTVAALVAILPVTFWIARAVFGLRGWLSLGVTALVGFSPILGYAVYQVAIGQLLAAPAIALITWAGVALWRGRLDLRRALGFAGVLAVGYLLVLGSYNFIVIVCLVPALAFALGQALITGRIARLGLWLLAMLAPLAVVAAVQAERVAGLAERFRLFQTYDFGWRIPGLTPEGWLGLVQGPGLDPWAGPWHGVLAGAVALALVAALGRGFARRDGRIFLAAACAVPVLLGYGFLLWRGRHLGTNASYDAYKLFAVFLPVLLPAFACMLLRHPARPAWPAAAALLAMLAGNLVAAGGFAAVVKTAPLFVDRDLRDLRRIEAMPEVHSLNLRIPEMWPRLWANALLLRRPQYFLTHTYEGRLNTPLRGEWDLDSGLIAVVLPHGDSRRLSAQYSLVRVGSPYYLRMGFGDGWHDPERLPRSSVSWRWSPGHAVLWVDNPQPRPQRVALTFDAASLVARDLQVWIGDRQQETVRLAVGRAPVRVPPVLIPPGLTRLELKSGLPPSFVGTDPRPLSFAAYGIEAEVLADPVTPP